MRLDYQILLKSSSLNLLAGSDPDAVYTIACCENKEKTGTAV